MGNDDITLVSTTDSAEQVQAALTEKPVKATEPPAEPAKDPAKAADATPAEPPAEPAEPETPEQKEEREVSEAGSKLAGWAKRQAKVQREIDDLTRNKYNIRRDVEAEEARLADLQRQRAELEAAQPKPAAPAAKGEPTPAPTESRQEPKLDALDEEGNAKYATYEDYLADYGKWIKEEAGLEARRLLDQERQAERARIEHVSVDRAVKERLATYNTNLEEFKKTHADFDAVFEDARAEVQDALVALGPEALKIVDGYTIFDAEDAPALTYYLLKHPDELKTIATRPPQQQLISLVRIEERLRAEGATSPPARPHATPETKAPAPIKPVGAGPTATTVPLDEEPYQDFKLRRERELKARRSA